MKKDSFVVLRVPRALKEKMEEVKRETGLNWSDYLREAIERKIREFEAKKAAVLVEEVKRKSRPAGGDVKRLLLEGRDRI